MRKWLPSRLTVAIFFLARTISPRISDLKSKDGSMNFRKFFSNPNILRFYHRTKCQKTSDMKSLISNQKWSFSNLGLKVKSREFLWFLKSWKLRFFGIFWLNFSLERQLFQIWKTHFGSYGPLNESFGPITKYIIIMPQSWRHKCHGSVSHGGRYQESNRG